MSVICQTFVQNAWRSDLCSNCFKCQDEHSAQRYGLSVAPQRYMPHALYQSRALSSSLIVSRLVEPIYDRVARRDFGSQTPPKANNLESQSRGILIKNHSSPEKKPLRSRNSVDFSSEEALVIGYGGHDYDSDQSPWEMASDDESVDLDLLDDTDEDRTISRLTKNNTRLNASNLPPPEDVNINNNNINNGIAPKNNSVGSVNKDVNINNCFNSKGMKQLTTYNDIQSGQEVDNTSKSQPQKPLATYYFSSNLEPLKSYLHNNHHHHNNNLNCKKSEERVVADFSPLAAYSIVSELDGKHQHSSDSDYSTCRGLTPGDSTDSSESFQDAEEIGTRPIPCRSFLHGSFPRPDKNDGGSSTSGDVSNLSDDSDGGDRTTFVKVRRTAAAAKEKKEQVVKRSVSCDVLVSSSTPVKPDILQKASEPAVNTPSTLSADSKPDNRQETDTKHSPTPLNMTLNLRHESTTPVTKTSPPRTTKSNEMKTPRKQAPVRASSVSSNESASGSPVDKTERSFSEKPTSTDKTQRTPPEMVTSTDKTTLEKTISTDKTHKTPSEKATLTDKTQRTPSEKATLTDKTHRTPSEKVTLTDKTHRTPSEKANLTDKTPSEKPSSIDKTQRTPSDNTIADKMPLERVPSDEESPESINNRQSKLAALALELELARRETEVKSGKAQPSPPVPAPPPEIKAKCTPRSVVTGTPSNYPTIKKGGGISCTSRLATLPDVIQESSSPTKLKKNRFSLKKLLKRNKDFAPPSTTPTNSKETNPKAWKKQTFDRNRLSLEILHPMDLSPPSSGVGTPTEEGPYTVSAHPGRGTNGRARSMSALPQLEDYHEPVLEESRKVDTLPNRKAGTVAERKKNRPSLVRTPSCSALPNRPQTTDRTPPPKPPPPPKCMQPPPPPPPPQPRIHKPASCSPARPPPPKIPETKSRIQSGDSSKTDSSNPDKEYANLGDIRSLLTPKKPERPSAVSVSRDASDGSRSYDEEEDHYTYLDDADRKVCKSPSVSSTESVGARPWVDLETSYGAIAAANYEALAEIVTSVTSLNESSDLFQDGGKGLKWKDFSMDEEAKLNLPGDRCVYDATYKPKGTRFTLLVTPKHPTTTHTHPLRPPLLCSLLLPGGASVAYVLPRPWRLLASPLPQPQPLRDACFLLLQLVQALKALQADGVEEVGSAERVLVAVEGEDERPPVLVLLPEDRAWMVGAEERKTLCAVTLEAMFRFLSIERAEDLHTRPINGQPLPPAVARTFGRIASALQEEKASSLSQAKGLLEYMLWGPVGVASPCLQRWLDLQRAQMLRGAPALLKGRHNRGAYELCQMAFLLQATVKSLSAVMDRL